MMEHTNKLLLIAAAFFLFFHDLRGQEVFSPNRWIEYIEDLAEDSEEENTESIEMLYDELSYLSENPMDLNRVTLGQLKQLPFLSEKQIQSILAHREKHGGFVSIYELKNITHLDYYTIELILPFVYVGDLNENKPFSTKNLLRYGRNEVMLNYNQSLEQKKGYKEVPDSILQKYPNRKYRGEPFYNSLRYSYSFDDRLQAGFVAEKDAGEKFAGHGYDYYSVHFFLKNTGKIKSLALGDFKASFGQGLVISNDFTPSRSSILSQAERRNNGFRRHYSTNESELFRGIASSVSLKNFNISMFYSYRKADGTLDSTSILSFKTDGMHRTEGDLDKKHTLNIQTAGGNIRYVIPNFLIGMTALTYSFGGLSVSPTPQAYNKFYFRGSRNTNIGMDYRWNHRKMTVYGETAVSQNGAVATLNALNCKVSSSLNTLILYRYYDRKYQAFYGSAFAQNSSVQNEEGLYLSMQWNPFAYWRISGYADIFRFPWLKYGVDAPSSGQEYMLQADFNKVKNTEISARYKFRQREKNHTEEHEVALLPTDQHRIRLRITHKPSKTLTLRTSAEGCIYNDESSVTGKGWMISQKATFSDRNHPLQADAYIAYFNTDDYNCRIFSYEKNMLYSFSMPSFYDHGMRFSAVLRYSFTKRLYLSVKAAMTHYFERDVIGTNLEEIEGHNKTDIYALIKWKF